MVAVVIGVTMFGALLLVIGLIIPAAVALWPGRIEKQYRNLISGSPLDTDLPPDLQMYRVSGYRAQVVDAAQMVAMANRSMYAGLVISSVGVVVILGGVVSAFGADDSTKTLQMSIVSVAAGGIVEAAAATLLVISRLTMKSAEVRSLARADAIEREETVKNALSIADAMKDQQLRDQFLARVGEVALCGPRERAGQTEIRQ